MTRRARQLIRAGLVAAALLATVFLINSWRSQTHARLSCVAMFEPRREHNGYLQINVLGPHPTEEMFEGQLFMYYPSYQQPHKRVRITRTASGSYAPAIIETRLVPFSQGLATSESIRLDLPTPGTSQRRFPFDSPTFDVRLRIDPAIRPTAVIVRNLSPDFIPECGSFTPRWDGRDELRIVVTFRRNPFVQGTVLLMAAATVIFAVLLGLIRETEDLAVATASYFFSVWSIRSIFAPQGLGYSSLLDLWLMGACLLVLFVVGWRLSKSPREVA